MKNEKIDFIEHDPKHKIIWDIIAQYSESAWFTHLADWIEIENQWNIEPHSFMVVQGGLVVGIVPLYLIKKRGFRYLMSGYKGWGGPAFLTDVKEDTIKATYNHIDSIAKKTEAEWIEVSLPLGIEPTGLVSYGFKVERANTSVINLEKNTIEKIYNKIDKKCRYEIRKSEKLRLNIQFTEALSLDDIKEYYKIHVENYKRTGAPPNPFWYFEDLYKRFNHDGIVRFFFIEENNKKVAAASIAVYKNHAIYLTGSSLNESLSKGYNHVLQWNIIKILYDMEGVSFYEMGEIENSTEKAKSLGKFKESFGGDLHLIYKAVKVYKTTKYKLYQILKRMKRWNSLKK